MVEKAVVDRIIDKSKAVLLVGENEIEYIIDATILPKGVKEGHWLKVQFEEGSIKKIELNEHETQKVKKRIEDKIAKLREKGGRWSLK